MIRHLNDLVESAKQKRTRKLVLAAAGDEDALLAVKNAVNHGLIEPVLVGNMLNINIIAKKIGFDISEYEATMKRINFWLQKKLLNLSEKEKQKY
jgi:phosphate butyryltransferase